MSGQKRAAHPDRTGEPGDRLHVAYVSAADPLGSLSGADITTKGWLTALRDRGLDVDVVYRDDEPGVETVDGLQIHALAGRRPRADLSRCLERIDPDVVLTQGPWVDLALNVADELGVPSVLSIVGLLGEEAVFASFSPTRLVANSRYTQQWIGEVFGRDSTLVYPHIDFDFYTAPDGSSDQVSMINPVVSKGGRLFGQLAGEFPDRQFLTKVGWYGVRNDDLSWDLDMLGILGETFWSPPEEYPDSAVRTPEEPDFDDVPNLTYVETPDILSVYARSRVLVVPSQWRETFGRVVIEAMWNGIPVVASHCGGLPEACGGAGLLVEEYADLDAWVEKLRRLDDPGIYDSFARRGRERAERYRRRQDRQIDHLVETLRDAATEG